MIAGENIQNTTTELVKSGTGAAAITPRQYDAMGLIPSESREKMNASQLIIASYEAPKIQEATDVQIQNTLKIIFGLIGIPVEKLPKDQQKTELFGFIKTHLKTYSLDDIRTAFELAVKREFMIGTPERHLELYDKIFNADYMCRVMYAYADYRMDLIRKHNLKKREEELELERQERERKRTPEEAQWEERKFLLKNLIKPYEHFCETGEYNFLPHFMSLLYDKLDKAGLIPLTVEEKREIKKEAQGVLKAEMLLFQNRKKSERYFEQTMVGIIANFNAGGFKKINPTVVSLAKDIAFKKSIYRLKEQGIGLREKLGLKGANKGTANEAQTNNKQQEGK